MHCRKLFPALVLIIFLSVNVFSQLTLPRSTPEAEGVLSSQIVAFLDAVSKSKSEMHSYMIVRHGKVIAEGWWDPYKPDLKHTLYSCSKSFTATAIGFAVQEKLLSLDDKVVSFFPDELPDTVSPFLAELNVRHVLTMTDGQSPDPTFAVTSRDSNWIKGFLATPIVDKPGSKFLYNSLGTYMLSAIIQKVTGQQLITYLTPRLFEPLGITGMDWETDPKGINSGGWGLRLKTEDMAKFAQLFLQKGKWHDKQVLPVSWVEEASSKHILQEPEARQSQRDSSDWMQGYGYQMWRCRHNAYRGDGAFGQFMIVMPEQDAVIALTAETADMQEEINLVWDYLLPAFKQEKLSENNVVVSELRKKEKMLALSAASNTAASRKIIKKVFELEPNEMGIKSISFDVTRKNCVVDFKSDSAAYKISFAPGKWQKGETNMPGPSLIGRSVKRNSFLYPAKIAAGYSWKEDGDLQLVLRYIESPHSETFNCHFTNDNVEINVAPSLAFGKHSVVLKGKAVSL